MGTAVEPASLTRTSEPRTTSAQLAWTALGCAITLTLVAYAVGGTPGALLSLGLETITVAVIVREAGARSRRDATPFWLLAAAFGAALAANLLALAVLDATHPAVLGLHLFAYAAGLASVATVAHLRAGGDHTSLVDAGIMAVALGLLAWVTLVAPVVTTQPLGQRLATIAFPLVSVVGLVFVLRLLFAPRGRTSAVWLLSGAWGFVIAGDVLSSGELLGVTNSVRLAGAAYNLEWALVLAAMLHPTIAEVTQAGPRPTVTAHPARFVVLTAAALLAPGILAFQTLGGGRIDGLAIASASALLFVLVLLRLMGLVRRVQAQAQRLEVASVTDPLTSATNRRGWTNALDMALARAARYGLPLHLALLDLDRFKHYNDSHGHAAGDVLLREAARSWQGVLRRTDVLARLGGDEFAVLMTGCTATDAVVLVERLRQVIPFGQTCSVGVARWNPGESPETLFERADRALYETKRSGRDRVGFAEEDAASTVDR